MIFFFQKGLTQYIDNLNEKIPKVLELGERSAILKRDPGESHGGASRAEKRAGEKALKGSKHVGGG